MSHRWRPSHLAGGVRGRRSRAEGEADEHPSKGLELITLVDHEPRARSRAELFAQRGRILRRRGGHAAAVPLGNTTIANAVVAKIAGLATREVPGVAGFGSGTARALGAVRERIPGARASSSQGVGVEVGERQAAVDLTIVVEYGVSVVDLAHEIRRNVITSLQQMTGLEVVEVNIAVVDLHVPGEDGADQPAGHSARVE